ncbi:MAG: Type 1 glutamine amidotransferase-like domain-containing protein [Micrococcales bacterium]|nr:Type 1 glutamine amidotransferase-like domain-containing protein [Micrococcales bacterium]
MVARLFLASFFKDVAVLFPNFADGACAGKKVCFIPTAALKEKMAFYVGADRKALAKLGLDIDDLEVSSASETEITNGISSADYVFLSGGNTFFLLQELRRTGADRLIGEHIASGKIYIGSSAGSAVLAKNVEYMHHMDLPGAAPGLDGDFAGLGVVDFCVVPHATNAPFKKAVRQVLAEYSDVLDLRPISNNQVVAVRGDAVETLTR